MYHFAVMSYELLSVFLLPIAWPSTALCRVGHFPSRYNVNVKVLVLFYVTRERYPASGIAEIYEANIYIK